MISKNRFTAAAAVFLVAALVLSGCGGKKKADPETQEVIKISVTPEPTPTEAPEVINPDAVTTSGNITMVNGYTKDGAASSEDTASDGTGDASGESQGEADNAEAAEASAEDGTEDTGADTTEDTGSDITEDAGADTTEDTEDGYSE